MGGQNQELDQTEPATPFKLQKARERGSIVRSNELVFAVVLLACVACVYGLGTQTMDGVALMIRRGVSMVAREGADASALRTHAQALGAQALRVIAPGIFVVWLAGLLSAALQARGVFSAQPLKPDFSRLNPATGLKRLFSIKSLHDLWRIAAKLAAVAVVMVIWGRERLHDIVGLSALGPRAQALRGISLVASALVLLTGVMVVFALLDWYLNRADFMRRMRMSKREIKDEHKQREGDPRIKARLRQLRAQWLQRARQLSRIRSADVLLTNPTHYAVALEYRHGQMPAPMVTARGAGEMAQRMRAEARRRAVPVVENAPLARALFALDESQVFVPEEHFDQVARVLRWVYAVRGRRGAGQVPA
jgi:flagellar biosynthesis protein FlhB